MSRLNYSYLSYLLGIVPDTAVIILALLPEVIPTGLTCSSGRYIAWIAVTLSSWKSKVKQQVTRPLITWVKVQNFQDPELSKLRS